MTPSRRGHLEEGVVTGHAEQAEANHQHAGDGAALEGDVERFVEADARGFRGAHVGAHRDVHADVAGRAGQHRADHEADRGRHAKEDADQHGQHRADHADGRVLTVQISLGAFLHRGGNLAHAIVAGRLRQDPLA